MPAPLTRSEVTSRARSLVVQPWLRHSRWLYLAMDAGLAVFAGVLWATGYPATRAAAVAAVAAAWTAIHVVEASTRRDEPPDILARRADVAELFMLALGFIAVAVTGGVRSPLLPGAFVALPLRLFQYGWSTQTKLHWGISGAGVLVAAALPRAWAGPWVGGALYATIAGGTALLVVAATLLYVGLLTRVAHESLREASRAREELTLQAIARARELEQLGAQLSHELKNPLSAIKTLVQLSRRAVQDAESREHLDVIESEIQRMQQILQDYLSFSRPLEKIRPEEIELGAVAGDVLALLAGRAAEAKVALRARGAARVDADPLRLKEALLNLLTNALEASPPGSRVDVEIVEVGDVARVVVRDRGRGMAPDVVARLGTPFFTTREDGTGLGVALARATFVRHGGTLTYASQPGEGTTATATLPTATRRLDGARARGG